MLSKGALEWALKGKLWKCSNFFKRSFQNALQSLRRAFTKRLGVSKRFLRCIRIAYLAFYWWCTFMFRASNRNSVTESNTDFLQKQSEDSVCNPNFGLFKRPNFAARVLYLSFFSLYLRAPGFSMKEIYERDQRTTCRLESKPWKFHVETVACDLQKSKRRFKKRSLFQNDL